MSNLAEIKARHKLELELAELEDELVKLKKSPGDGKRLRKVKDDLRAVRAKQRADREGA